MKKAILMLCIGMFLAGCAGTAKEAEFYTHPMMYKNWEHLKFSWWGYEHPTEQSYRMSVEQEWWGISIPYTPSK